MEAPPKETMQALTMLISPILSEQTSTTILETLNTHKTQLLSHIHSSSESSEIRYRVHHTSTKLHPKPTKAEEHWLSSHELPLSKSLAALHLRDFLHETFPTSIDRLLHSTNLMSHAPPHRVFQFAVEEVQAAYKALATMFTNSQLPHFAKFLEASQSQIRDAIIKATNALLTPNPQATPRFTPIPVTVLSLLLTACSSRFFSFDNLLPLIAAYNKLIQSPSANLHPMRNDPSLYLLTAAITTSIRNQYPTQAIPIDSLRPLLKHDSVLPVLVSLSVSSALPSAQPNPTTVSETTDLSREFMTHALSADALEKLRDLLQEPFEELDSESRECMFNAFTEDLLSFLASFPPRSLEPTQIEQLSRLVTGLMSRSEPKRIAKIANSMWEEDIESPLARGLRSILNLSSALYPLSFRPLITLLQQLAADTRSAVYVAEYLEMRIMTLCESAEGYSDALIALDEDEDLIWDKLRDYCRNQPTPRVLSDVRMGETMVFVQAMREIPGGTYRGGLPAGLVGVSDDSFSTVAWVHAWNGFNAVVFALDTLHDLLYSDAPPSSDFDAVVEDLVESAVESMRFLQKLCLNGTESLRQHLCERVGVTDTIARIVAEILAMKGKANFSQEWLQILLKSASSCLPPLIGNDPVYANRVASILSCTVKLDRFGTTISSFGETGLAVLAALASVSLVVPDETFSPRSIDAMTDFAVDDTASGTFRELMTRLLCSGNLATSAVMSRDRDPPVGWLPILWSMRVLQDRPDILLCSSSAAKLFEFVILHTASRHPFSHSEALLYPTACEAVIACLNALRYRSKSLCSRPNGYASPQGNAKGSSSENKLTALEEVLLRPELVEAMALLSCSSAKRLQDDRFYTEWSTSDERFLLPVRDVAMDHQSYELLLNSEVQTSESGGTAWLCNVVTRCLSLQVDCLSHFEDRSGIPQIPWPSCSSTLESDFCTGAVVRERIARRIAQGHGGDLLRLLVAVLSCRQRAALRSLCGPRRSSEQNNESSEQETKCNAEVRDPIPAVIHCLKHTFESYKKLLAEDSEKTGPERLEYLRRAGQLSMVIAYCVRVLRLGMKSQNSRWFRDYVDSDFWKLLTSLVKSDAGNNDSTSFSLIRATQDWFACKNVTEWWDNLKLDSWKQLLAYSERIFDVGSIWKNIAAEVFHVTSTEILAEVSEDLLAPGSNETGADCRLKESLLERPLFRAFAGVFSERWVSSLLGTEHVRDCGNYSDRMNNSQGPARLGAIPTLSNLTQNASQRIAETTNITSSKYDMLSEFDRSGDLAAPYGLSYAYDIAKLARFLRRKQVSEERSAGLILSVMDINVAIARKDVYVDVLSAFSSMASIILFADSLCPAPTLALSYASPQFGGKLCRYLPRVVMSLLPSTGAFSWHSNTAALEVSKLLCMLSTRLSEEELEIEALTAMDYADFLEVPRELHLSTPLGHICHIINRIVSTESSQKWSSTESGHRQEVISWFLLTASRYAEGPAFYTGADLQSLVQCCMSTLEMDGGTSEVCKAVATALTATITRMPSDMFSVCFNQSVFNVLQSSVDSAATKLSASDQRSRAKCMTALLLTLTRAVIKLQSGGNAHTFVSFRQINASGVHLLLPSKGASMKMYDFEQDERNPCHTLWCSMLQLVAVAIPSRPEADDTNMIDSDEKRHVIEFCSVNLERIVGDSLDLQKGQQDVPERVSPHMQLHTITLAKIEEAELGATILSKLSSFGLVLQNSMPSTTRRALEQLCRYAAQAIQILRTDPIERWVRPVTQRERERSGVAMEQLTSIASQPTASMSPSPLRRSRLTPKKSPSQALRAAVGGKPWQGSTPSPGSSLTPFLSPLPARAKEDRSRPANFSPTSPWAHHGSGLITKTGEYFDEEVTKSLLRGLCAALDGIRQFSEQLGVFPFKPSMDITSDTAGIGTLLSILKYSCWALHREVDEERRSCVQGIADTTMNLILSHAMSHAEAGSLPQSVRDEVRKRVTTALYRVRNLVPPLPPSSILLDEGLMSLWKRF